MWQLVPELRLAKRTCVCSWVSVCVCVCVCVCVESSFLLNMDLLKPG